MPFSAARSTNNLALALLLVVKCALGVIWAFAIAPFDAPDEPSHFNHIMQIRDYGLLPVVVMPTATSLLAPPSTPLDAQTVALANRYGYSGFEANAYESSQPPLFYTVAALLTAPLGDDRLSLLYAARLVAVLFGMAAVGVFWWVLRALWPDRPLLFWSSMASFVLLPQFSFTTSAVSNDCAVLFCGVLLFAVWVGGLRAKERGTRRIYRWALLAGLVFGLGLLAKSTIIACLPPTLLWLFWISDARQGLSRERLRLLGGALAVLAVIMGAVAGWWYARNILLYGEPSGTSALFDLYRQQNYYLLSSAPPTYGSRLAVILRIVFWTFISFWSHLGWGDLDPDIRVYLLPLLLLLVGVVSGLRLLFRHNWRAPALPQHWRSSAVLLGAIAALGAYINLWLFNIGVGFQPQARYMFVALGPIILLLVLSLYRSPLSAALNRIMLICLPAVLLLMNGLSILALYDRLQSIVPK